MERVQHQASGHRAGRGSIKKTVSPMSSNKSGSTTGPAGAYQRIRAAEAAGRNAVAARSEAAGAAPSESALPLPIDVNLQRLHLAGIDNVTLDAQVAAAQVAVKVLSCLDVPDRADFVTWLRACGIDRPLHNVEGLDKLLDEWFKQQQPRELSLPFAEFERRHADGMDIRPSESFADWNARVRANRVARGAELGEYFTNQYTRVGFGQRRLNPCEYDGERKSSTWEVPGQTCDHYESLESLGDLVDYGTRPGDWTPSGPVPAPHNPRPAHLQMLDTPEITTYCCFCNCLRPGERGLSRIECQPDGSLRRVGSRCCRRCVTGPDPEDCDG